MNQFRLDLDATRCAQAHQDAHCGKMLFELTQQLCTAFPDPGMQPYMHRRTAERLAIQPCTANPTKRWLTVYGWWHAKPEERLRANTLPYRRTKAQYSNPVCVWTRATRANFDNTVELAQALAVEFRHRFGKPHGSEAALDWVVRHRAEAQVPDGPQQLFALAMPEEYAVTERIRLPVTGQLAHVLAYRAYYRVEKRGYWRKSRDPAKPSTWVPAKWTKRDPPEWF